MKELDRRILLDKIFDSSLDAIIITDENGYIGEANEAYVELTGYKKDEIIGKHTSEFSPMKEGTYECTTGELVQIDKKFSEKLRATMKTYIETGKMQNVTGYQLGKDGKVVPVEDIMVFLVGDDGERIGGVAVIRDNTERRKAEIELQKTKEYLENIFMTSVDGVIIGDSEGEIVAVNKAVEKIFDCSPDQLVGKHTAEMGFVKGKDKISGKELIEILLSEGAISGVERTLKKPGGDYVVVEMNIALLKDDDGNMRGSVASIRDITDRKQAEDRLRDSEERVRALLNAPFEAILLIENNGTTLDFNKAYMERFNKSADELRGSCCWDLLPPELVKSRQMIVDKAFQRGEPIRSEDQREGKFLENATYPIFDQAGEVTIVAIFSRDISENKQALDELKISRDYSDNIIESSLDSIVVTDVGGYFTRVNNAFLQLTGFSEAEVIGKHMSEFSPTIEGTYECSTGDLIQINEEFYKQVESKMLLFIEKGIMHNAIGYLLCKDNKIVPVEDSMVYLTDTEGMRVGAVAIARDITERKKAEQKLLEHQNRLKALTSEIMLTEEKERRRFSEFLHDEIGQYLFATQLQLELLKSSVSSAENTKILDNAINDIKDAIEHSRSLTFELSSPILYELGLEKALEWLAENTHKKYGITVTFEDDKQEKPLEDNGKILLYQAVSELFVNVAKHSHTKSASLSIKRDNSNVRICVEDNGVGFYPPNKDSSNVNIEGFGLFRIKERLEQLGGQLEIESQPNHGTQVILISPLKNTT